MANLIIGIGGTGLETISRLRTILTEKDDLQYYYLDSSGRDTDAQPPGRARYLGGFPVENVVERQWDKISSWWYPKDYVPHYLAELGTGKNRLIGRIGFFMNGKPIEDDLNRIFASLPGPQTTIYIVCSLGGGQGSSIVVDVAMLCRSILTKQNKSFSIYGVLLDFGVVYNLIDQKEETIKAGLATLTEIEYYNAINFRKSPLKYQFQCLNSAPVSIEKAPPFDVIFLVQYKNQQGEMFNDKSDYYELLANGLRGLIIVKDKNADIRGFPQRVGSGTGIENFLQWFVEKPEHGRFSLKWGSFGLVALDLPIEEITEYCRRRAASDILGDWLRPASEKDKGDSESRATRILDDAQIWESNDRGGVYKRIMRILRNETQSALFEDRSSLARRLGQALDQAKENFPKTLDNWRKELSGILDEYEQKKDKILNHPDIEALINRVLTSLDEARRELMNLGKIDSAKNLCELFQAHLGNERNDLAKKLDSCAKIAENENRIQLDINAAITEIQKKKKRFFESRKRYNSRLKARKESLAQNWVENYYGYYVNKTFLPVIHGVYDRLIQASDKEVKLLTKFVAELNDLQGRYRYDNILDSSIDITGRKEGRTDFILSICGSEQVVSEKVYPKIDVASIKSQLLSSGIEGFRQELLEELIKKAVDNSLSLNLESGLEYEADYLYGSIAHALQNSPEHEIPQIREENSKYIDLTSFDKICEMLTRRKKGERIADGKFLEEIMKGRVLTVFNEFALPFWTVDRSVDDGSAEGAYPLGQSLLTMNEKLGRLKEIVASCKPGVPTYNNENPRRLEFYVFEGGMPIITLTQITSCRDVENKRRSHFIQDGKVMSPDDMGTNSCCYNDRLFISDAERSRFSIFPEEKTEIVYRYFALSELFELISAGTGRREVFKVKADLSTQYPADYVLGRGLKNAVEAISNSASLNAAIVSFIDDKMSKAEIESSEGLRHRITELHRKYANLMREGSEELREIYRNLRHALESTGFVDKEN